MDNIVPLGTRSNSLKAFKQQLLRYKARVYEQYMTPVAQQAYHLEQAKLGKPAILVIEDNIDEWLLIRHTLSQQFPAVDLMWVASPSEATGYFKKCLSEERPLPYFVLVDLYLPTAQLGLGLIKTLKAHSLFQSIPFITISRSDQVEDISQAFMHSSDGYIVKPSSYVDWSAAFGLLTKYVPVLQG